MKLFVWANPYHVDYGSTLVFAVAETEEEARKIIRVSPGYSYGEYPDAGGGDTKLGEPTRVVDLPCAEWHKWQD